MLNEQPVLYNLPPNESIQILNTQNIWNQPKTRTKLLCASKAKDGRLFPGQQLSCDSFLGTVWQKQTGPEPKVVSARQSAYPIHSHSSSQSPPLPHNPGLFKKLFPLCSSSLCLSTTFAFSQASSPLLFQPDLSGKKRRNGQRQEAREGLWEHASEGRPKVCPAAVGTMEGCWMKGQIAKLCGSDLACRAMGPPNT